MNPPGNMETFRAWLVAYLQTFPDFVSAQSGFNPLTTFSSPGVVEIVGGIPQSSIFGRVKGTLVSAINAAVSRVGISISVDMSTDFVSDQSQSASCRFTCTICILIAENPEINLSAQGTGLSALFMAERIHAALKEKTVPTDIVIVAGSIMPATRPSRDIATDRDELKGYDIKELYFDVQLSTPPRNTP